jgi:hypothetical protein
MMSCIVEIQMLAMFLLQRESDHNILSFVTVMTTLL